MKAHHLGFTLAVLFTATLPLFSMDIDVTGTWEVTMASDHGEFVSKGEFIQEGEALTVKMDGRTGKGTVKGSEIEWQIVLATGMGDVDATFKGKVDGGAMLGEVEIMGTTTDWAARKK